MRKLTSNLSFQVLVAITLGIVAGILFPSIKDVAQLLATMFINLIHMLIAPIIFFTIVHGISGMDNMKKMGRVGGKALLYFEVITTLALIIGVFVANYLQPGAGLQPEQFDTNSSLVEKYKSGADGLNWKEFILHIIPKNAIGAFATGDILQVLVFAILFGYGLQKFGAKGDKVQILFGQLSSVFFNILKFVMKLAPIGAFGGMAYALSAFGTDSLKPLFKLMICVYITMAVFIFVVLNAVCRMAGVSLWKYLKFIRNEILIVLGTSSSESVLPNMMERMEKLGCEKSIVGLVIPSGYSFNLDGTTIYLSMSVIFLAQVFHVDLSLAQQLIIILILMITSKGAAGVTGSGFIVLVSTLSIIKVIPIEGVAILLGVDRFMSEARAITNMIGNGIACIVVAKSENAFDQEKYIEATTS